MYTEKWNVLSPVDIIWIRFVKSVLTLWKMVQWLLPVSVCVSRLCRASVNTAQWAVPPMTSLPRPMSPRQTGRLVNYPQNLCIPAWFSCVLDSVIFLVKSLFWELFPLVQYHFIWKRKIISWRYAFYADIVNICSMYASLEN